MNKNIPFKKAFLAAAMGLLSTSVMADAGGTNWSLSGWINQGVTYADDGENSDIVSMADNGATLGSRMTFAGSTDLPAGLSAGFEVIIEPRAGNDLGSPVGVLGFGSAGAPVGSPDSMSNLNGDSPYILGHSVFFSGAFGKFTFGLQTMPTDNIAVLEDPSLTLWSSISPIFRGTNIGLRGATGTPVTTAAKVAAAPAFGVGGNPTGRVSPGDFAQCFTTPGLNIGIDCNGIYRQGVRYDLPTFIENLSLAVGWANDDVYDVMGKYRADLGRLKGSIALGYAQNNGASTAIFDSPEMFAMQAGLMDPVTGLFGSIAYQNESVDLLPGASVNETDDSDAYWLKVGIKKQWNALGDTSLAFQYGSYNDQYTGLGASGITGSELERIGVEVNQYFGSRLIIYGVWENLSADVDSTAAGAALAAAINGADDVNTFTLGLTFFY